MRRRRRLGGEGVDLNLSVRCRKGRKAHWQTLCVVCCAVSFGLYVLWLAEDIRLSVSPVTIFHNCERSEAYID